MSLDWSVKNVADYNSLWVIGIEDENGSFRPEPTGPHKKLNTVTHILIMSMMSIGIGRITEANAKEVHKRLTFMDKLYGGRVCHRVGEEYAYRSLTLEEVERHIGLSTNVSNTAEGVWLKNVYRNFDVK